MNAGGLVLAGRELWEHKFLKPGNGQLRSCAICHGGRPENPGKHARRGKSIEPMAASINRERFSDPRKIRKWLKQNCRAPLFILFEQIRA